MKKTQVCWQERQAEFESAISDQELQSLSSQWLVSKSILKALGVGWSRATKMFTFPERDADGRVVGILIRNPETGRKRMLKGSQRGLCFSSDWKELPGPILVPEGVSDTAALLAYGLCSIGRPSSNGGFDLLEKMLGKTTREIIIIGEIDRKPDGKWPGRDGARQTAKKLANRLGRNIGWSLPPREIKDIRAFLERSVQS